MWADCDISYREALRDKSFLAWREAGARQKAINIALVCRGIPVYSAIEIGCGTGAVLRELGSMNFAKRYIATDVSARAIEFVRESCGSLLSGAIAGDADSLPFPEKSFSVAILSHVIEHLENPVCAVRDAARVAEYIVIEVPTEKVLSNTIRTRILGKPFASAAGAGHLQFWSASSIATFLEDTCGLEILSRHRDLLSREIEYHEKNGAHLVKPIFKQALKSVLSGWVYARLLTTHATFLCRERECQTQRRIVAENDLRQEAS